MTREEAASCINTIVILKNLCYRVHGLMDVIDHQNCDKIIEMLNTVGETHKKHTETHASDCVSRQAAIDAVNNAFDRETLLTGFVRSIAVRAIRNMPSAQPERKKGKWIRITQGAIPEQYICPFCHRTVETYGVEELLSIRYPYCHCGADMRGEQDE